MALGKTEIGLYAAGGVGLLVSAVLLATGRRRAGWPTLALAGTLTAGGGVATFCRRRGRVGLDGGLRAPLGLVESNRVMSGGMRLRAWDDAEMGLKERVHLIQGLVADSAQDPTIIKKGLHITNHCPSRDDRCELQAIHDWTYNNIRYTGDTGAHALGPGGPVEPVDRFQSAKRTIEFKGGDCLPAGTLLLVEGHRLVPIEDVLPGTKIWGYDRWSTVEDIWPKGILPVDAVFMNNGSSFKATAEHKVYIARCLSHPVRWDNGKSCSCPIEEREITRVGVGELEPGMVLLQPERLPFGTESMDPDRAYVEGLYLSDGSCGNASSFDIAGQDGCPKEAQKREVAEICARLDIPTTWCRKYISVRDKPWTTRMHQMGHRAPLKHALSINIDEGAAVAMLRGIMADSGANTRGSGRTFTSTSRMLTIQTRLLHRMLGLSCGERYIVDHGGLGENPIWRLQVRTRQDVRADGKRPKLLRVKAVEHGVMRLPTYDLTTDDHKVYLPESDVTVSQCDDHTILNASLALANGFPVKMRITSNRGDSWDHIYALAGVPKLDPRKWVALDTTLRSPKLGRQPRRAKYVDFAA